MNSFSSYKNERQREREREKDSYNDSVPGKRFPLNGFNRYPYIYGNNGNKYNLKLLRERV